MQVALAHLGPYVNAVIAVPLDSPLPPAPSRSAVGYGESFARQSFEASRGLVQPWPTREDSSSVGIATEKHSSHQQSSIPKSLVRN